VKQKMLGHWKLYLSCNFNHYIKTTFSALTLLVGWQEVHPDVCPSCYSVVGVRILMETMCTDPVRKNYILASSHKSDAWKGCFYNQCHYPAELSNDRRHYQLWQ